MSRGPKNFYAVSRGRKTGIFTTWGECEKQVKGYKNARFKGFYTRAEAEAFLGKPQSRHSESAIDAAMRIASNDYTIAYCDGSYNEEYDAFSYGVVIVTKDGEYVELSKRIDYSEFSEYWNVAGEVHGAMAALQYCEENKLSPVILHYDYEGIGAWATGAWRARSEISVAYLEFLSKLTIKVYFQKVKGHSGDPLNERCDELARNAMRGYTEGSRASRKRNYTFIDAYLDRFYPISRWSKSHIMGRIEKSYPDYAERFSKMLLSDLQHWFLVKEEYLEANAEYNKSAWYLAFNSALNNEQLEAILSKTADHSALQDTWKKIAEYDNDLTQSVTIRASDTGRKVRDCVIVSIATADGKRGYKAIRYNELNKLIKKPELLRGEFQVDTDKMKEFLLSSPSFHMIEDRFIVPAYIASSHGETAEQRVADINGRIREDRTPFMVSINGAWFVYIHRTEKAEKNYPIEFISNVCLMEFDKNFHPSIDYRGKAKLPEFYDSFRIVSTEPRDKKPDEELSRLLSVLYYPADRERGLCSHTGSRASIRLSDGTLIKDAILTEEGRKWIYPAAYRTSDALGRYKAICREYEEAVKEYQDLAEAMKKPMKNCLGYLVPMDWPVGKKTKDISLLINAAHRYLRPGLRLVYTDANDVHYIVVFNGNRFELGDAIPEKSYISLTKGNPAKSLKYASYIDKNNLISGFRVIRILDKPNRIDCHPDLSGKTERRGEHNDH